MNSQPLLLAALAGALLLSGCGANTGLLIRPVPTYQNLQEMVVASDPGWFVRDKIAVIDVEGILVNERDTGLFASQENPVSLFVEKIDKAQADPDVRALVLRINTPGGGVTASDILYQRVQRFRRARPEVPVIAAIQDLGTSGGYYVACAADAIVAQPTSLTGSIGVIMQTFSVAGTMRLLRIEAVAVTSGPHKDMISPLAPLEAEDLAIVQDIVDQFHERFIAVIVAGRPDLAEGRIRELADGRVYTGIEAHQYGLVDALGSMNDAVLLAKRRSGADRVQVVMYDRPLGYRANVYSQGSVAAPQVNLVNVSVPGMLDLARPRFLYLWSGQFPGPR